MDIFQFLDSQLSLARQNAVSLKQNFLTDRNFIWFCGKNLGDSLSLVKCSTVHLSIFLFLDGDKSCHVGIILNKKESLNPFLKSLCRKPISLRNFNFQLAASLLDDDCELKICHVGIILNKKGITKPTYLNVPFFKCLYKPVFLNNLNFGWRQVFLVMIAN